MNKQKPVWRMNTGCGVPSDVTRRPKVLFSGGILGGFASASHLEWSNPDIINNIVVAYQTNRTKAAKYELVDCEECLGGYEGSFDPSGAMGYMQSTNKCKNCNGKGYRLEAVK